MAETADGWDCIHMKTFYFSIQDCVEIGIDMSVRNVLRIYVTLDIAN
jgi:hypothetical protein